jgi:uncharacterized protein YdiU (UPF0061 family)
LPPSPHYRPEKIIEELAEGFFDKVSAAEFPQHTLRYRNQRWAERVGLGGLTGEEWINHFGRFAPLPGNLETPLALRYHGHQFRSYNPDLGDGRGFLFAQMRDVKDNRLLDLGTKGSGKTPWSRQGDGRLTLKGGMREVLATAMLEALGVDTSKSFSLIETGESLMRGDEPSPTRSSVLVRLSHSHIRIGSFQRHAFHGDEDKIWQLLRYSVRHYMPELGNMDGKTLPGAFLKRVVEKVARVGAEWMAAGFVHGVLNTDNINITGESFDYGPYRFLPTLDPGFTAAYFDREGLYSFGRQLETLAWNLDKLGGTLTLISEREPLVAALQAYSPTLDLELRRAYLARLGLKSTPETDDDMLRQMNHFLAESQVSYDQFFFDWYGGKLSSSRAAKSPEAEKYSGESFDKFRALLAPYKASAPEKLEQDYFKKARPCSLLIDEIEAIWAEIAHKDDWSLFEAKLNEIEEMRRVLRDYPACR